MSTSDMWTYPQAAGAGTLDLTGYSVEAADGSIGKIDESSTEVGASYLVVDTGPWIFGKKVVLPAGVVETVDHDDEKVFVNRTKDEIENAPEYNDARFTDAKYRGEIGLYYGGPGPTI